MKTAFRARTPVLFAILASVALGLTETQTNASDTVTKEKPPLNVDRVVAHPGRFKDKISVAGRVAKTDPDKHVLALGCEDACVSMPVKFSGDLPKVGRDIIVRGQIRKDKDGKYVFEAESVTAKK